MSLEETEIFNAKALDTLIRKAVREEMQAIAHEDRLLTAEQAAEALGYPNPDSVRRLAREGHLQIVNLGENTRRFKNSEVQRLVRNGIG